MEKIYFDHAATTPVDERVLQKMLPYFSEKFGNPNSQHFFGREAVSAGDEAANEIYFTSGGTESDNWALRGTAYAMRERGKHLIVSAVEHPAMITTAKELMREGFDVTFAEVDEYGVVDADKLIKEVREDTVFIGIMAANNEVGSIQPIKKIAAFAKEKGIVFFTDAVQAAGAMKLDVKELGVDMLSFSGHKFYGPKGIGVLYVRSGLKLGKIITGGHQERGMRGGTTNTPAIVGMAEALRIADREREENNCKISALRDRFIARVLKEIPYIRLNGHPNDRLPANANFSFEYVEGEALLYNLDLAGIAVSSGSACTSGSLEPSHVLLAMGLDKETAKSSIRFSFGRENSAEEVDFAVDKLKEIIVKLRSMSATFPKNLKNEVFEKE